MHNFLKPRSAALFRILPLRLHTRRQVVAPRVVFLLHLQDRLQLRLLDGGEQACLRPRRYLRPRRPRWLKRHSHRNIRSQEKLNLMNCLSNRPLQFEEETLHRRSPPLLRLRQASCGRRTNGLWLQGFIEWLYDACHRPLLPERAWHLQSQKGSRLPHLRRLSRTMKAMTNLVRTVKTCRLRRSCRFRERHLRRLAQDPRR